MKHQFSHWGQSRPRNAMSLASLLVRAELNSCIARLSEVSASAKVEDSLSLQWHSFISFRAINPNQGSVGNGADIVHINQNIRELPHKRALQVIDLTQPMQIAEKYIGTLFVNIWPCQGGLPGKDSH